MNFEIIDFGDDFKGFNFKDNIALKYFFHIDKKKNEKLLIKNIKWEKNVWDNGNIEFTLKLDKKIINKLFKIYPIPFIFYFTKRKFLYLNNAKKYLFLPIKTSGKIIINDRTYTFDSFFAGRPKNNNNLDDNIVVSGNLLLEMEDNLVKNAWILPLENIKFIDDFYISQFPNNDCYFFNLDQEINNNIEDKTITNMLWNQSVDGLGNIISYYNIIPIEIDKIYFYLDFDNNLMDSKYMDSFCYQYVTNGKINFNIEHEGIEDYRISDKHILGKVLFGSDNKNKDKNKMIKFLSKRYKYLLSLFDISKIYLNFLKNIHKLGNLDEFRNSNNIIKMDNCFLQDSILYDSENDDIFLYNVLDDFDNEKVLKIFLSDLSYEQVSIIFKKIFLLCY